MKREQFQLIEKYSKEQMDKLGLYGWPHVKRVLRLCVRMARVSREKNVDLDVLKASALLHDIAKLLRKKNTAFDHGDMGAKLAETFLRKCNFDKGKIEAICHAIRAHTHLESRLPLKPKFYMMRISWTNLGRRHCYCIHQSLFNQRDNRRDLREL